MKKIIIDKNKCIGCFKCKEACYSIFEIDIDGKAKAKSEISKNDLEEAKKAIMVCPTNAIRIEGKNSLFDIFKKKVK